MAGISVTISTTGLDELRRSMTEAAAGVREQLEDAMAEQAIAYNQDLRGSGPGGGLTPFRGEGTSPYTGPIRGGNLLLSGNIEQKGLTLEFVNDVKDPRTGAEYAEWAHKSGDSTGGYARSSGVAFGKRFDAELVPIIEKITAEALAAKGAG